MLQSINKLNNLLMVSCGDYYVPSSEDFKFSEETIRKLEKGDSVIKFTVEVINLDGTPTRNNCVYLIDEMKIAIKRERITQLFNTGVFYGELEHPDNPEDLNRWTKIDRRRVHFKFTKLWFEGTRLMGEVQTVSGNGDLMLHAIKCGELPSFSIRVIGKPTQRPDGVIELREIHLVAIDWVTYPGNPTSYVTSSDAFKVVTAPLYKDGGFDYPILKASGESNSILKELGVGDTLISLGNGMFVEYNEDLIAKKESVQFRNNVRRNVLI